MSVQPSGPYLGSFLCLSQDPLLHPVLPSHQQPVPGREAGKVGLPSPLSQTPTVSTQEEGLGSRRRPHLAAGRQAAIISPTAQLTEEEPEAREGNHLPREGHFLECD